MSERRPLGLFEGYGIELEYMIVERDTLNVLPVTDKVLHKIAGKYENEVELGKLGWSNELALHVLELKTNGPWPSLEGMADMFHDHVKQINGILAELNGQLMPSSMHPWMEPLGEMKLWPHENSPIYEAYNRIFNCKGHGWANLQSMHINLPFKNDEEFARLHAAIRLVLPLLPGIAAASPIADGELKPFKDYRLNVYRSNQKKIPSIAGQVIPEAVFSEGEYREKILKRMYDDIAPFDPECILQDEWLNSRGAIARFDRNTIEIRLIDIQECPAADIAIAELVIGAVRTLCNEELSSLKEQKLAHESELSEILFDHIQAAEDTIISHSNYLNLMGYKGDRCTSKQLWDHLAAVSEQYISPASKEIIKTISSEGTLSTRISGAINHDLTHEHIRDTYQQLCRCLDNNRMFRTHE